MKKRIKFIVRFISVVLTFPFAFVCNITKNDNLMVSFGQFFSLLPGKIGSYIRVGFYRQVLSYCAKDIFIGFGTYFSQKEVVIRDGVYIGAFCIIGKVELGQHVTIGSGVHVLSGKKQHNFKEIGVPIQQQGGLFERVFIGENTWIGSCAVILESIGVQNVIGAGAVVTKETGDFEILAGNPALIKGRITMQEDIFTEQACKTLKKTDVADKNGDLTD